MVAPCKGPCLGLLGDTAVNGLEGGRGSFPTAERAEELALWFTTVVLTTDGVICPTKHYRKVTLCMMETLSRKTTPGGTQHWKSTVASCGADKPSESGELEQACKMESETSGSHTDDGLLTNTIPVRRNLRTKKCHYFGTINIQTLLQTGKLKRTLDEMEKQNILILAVQETRFTDISTFDSENYRIFKGKPGRKIGRNLQQLGTAFCVNKRVIDSVTGFCSPSDRLSILTLKCANKRYTLFNAHAPINEDNRKNPEKVKIFWDQLESEFQKTPSNHVKILMGDFNAQVGKERQFRRIVGYYPAHIRTNTNGKRLIELCEIFDLKLMSTYFKRLPRKKKTWCAPRKDLGEYQLDHVAISRRNVKEIMNVEVRKGANLDSDHFLTRIKFKPLPLNKKRLSLNVPIKVNHEKLHENRNDFQILLRERKVETYQHISEKMANTAKDVAPLRRTRRHRWWTTDCDEAVDSRAVAYKAWYADKTEAKFETYKEVRKQTAKTLRQAKRNQISKEIQSIDTEFKKNNTRTFYRTFKKHLTGYQPSSMGFRRDDGTLALNKNENCDILATYFEKLLNCEKPINKWPREDPKQQSDNSIPPDENELREIITDLKNNKAAGEDSITAEMLKSGGEIIINILRQEMEKIWETEVIPVDWTSALIHPIHKKGDRTDPNNYRGISIVPVTYKALSKALQTRLVEQVDHQLGEYQAGFRKGRSCVEQIWSLKRVLENYSSKDLVVVFVDFKKAYDSIDREVLFNILVEFGVDAKTTEIIKQTLTGTHSKVKFMGGTSTEFEIKTGVRQGDGLSPVLFNCVLEKIIREWEKELDRKGLLNQVYIGGSKSGVKINCLAFADDLALLSRNTATAIEHLNVLQRQAEKAGLQISFKKTKYMTNIKTAPRHLQTEHGKIDRVDSFKYLGEIVQLKTSEREANNTRREKMAAAFRRTYPLYKKKAISRRAKLRHYNTVIKTECLYASECLQMTGKAGLRDAEKFERKILRKIMGPKIVDGQYRLRGREELYRDNERLMESMRKRRLKFYGHLFRMDEQRLTKKIFKILDSRPKVSDKWFREVRKDLHQVGLNSEDISNRTKFRSVIDKFQGFHNEPKLNSGWTEERRQAARERMQRFWAAKKGTKFM